MGAELRNSPKGRAEMSAELKNGRKRLLLHSCCGPCSTAVLERLSTDYQITLFYYNPNITDFEEYNRRKETQLQAIRAFQDQGESPGSSVAFLEGPYETDRFYQVSAGLEREPEGGKRCEACFRLRLGKTAEMADRLGFNFFTTTLSVSPHKDAKLLNQIGKDLNTDQYLEADFKKKAGYQRSIQMSKEYGLYRQSYCGCCFAKAIMEME